MFVHLLSDWLLFLEIFKLALLGLELISQQVNFELLILHVLHDFFQLVDDLLHFSVFLVDFALLLFHSYGKDLDLLLLLLQSLLIV